jgi:hypothetical protein
MAMGKHKNKTKQADKGPDHPAKVNVGLDLGDAYRPSPILDDFAEHPEGANIKLERKF